VNGADVTTVGVGKYVTPDVFVKYAQGLNASTDRELSVEWRLNKVLLLTGETRHRLPTSPGTTAVESESNIDLKARWEF
jgi:autotransporter translocation and assembly factor TamB